MTFKATAQDAGSRLDQFLAHKLPEASRARLQEWIKQGRVRVGETLAKPSLRLRGGERIEVAAELDEARPPLARAFAEEIPLDVLYEDDDLAAINKPAGMTVHAGAGVSQGTLVNALLHHFGKLSDVGGALRPGIVHRLDRLTSGVVLVAKNDAAHRALARQFAERSVEKTYLALVQGTMPENRGRAVWDEGVRWTRLEMPIQRDRARRTRMTARSKEGRAAVTDFRVLERWPGFSFLEVRIHTGRTHQIRAHLAAVGHPVAGDRLYGAAARPGLGRIFLHAAEIGFTHPVSGEKIVVRAPLAPELKALLLPLRGQREREALL